MGPVEVDASEEGALGGLDGGVVLRLEERVGAWVAGDLAGAGIDLGGLPGGFGFEDGVPAPGIDGIGLDGDAAGRGWRDLRLFDEVTSSGVFGPAPAPEDDHAGERCDGPGTAAEARAACAYFAIGEAEQRWEDEGDEQQRPDDGFGDEDEVAGVPAGVEGEERADAVVVGPVEEDVAEDRR
jgi:hypothetical protein